MSEKVELVGVKKQHGRYIYFVDEDGDVARVRSAEEGTSGGVPEKVARTGVEKEPGYLYYVDQDGDLSRAWLGRR